MKETYLLLAAILFSIATIAQPTTSNYTFSTGTTGSLTDMNSGTTQLIAADQDDAASAITTIGFDFW